MNIEIPADVSSEYQQKYVDNVNLITKGTGNLLLLAGDQRLEHLNADFVGENISPEDADPKHLFEIASKSEVGALAIQRGLIAKYGRDYPNVNYIVKMNSKTNLPEFQKSNPLSLELWDFSDIDILIENGLKILGVGYTIFIGSENEEVMLAEAGRLVADAHCRGLVVILWCYARGSSVADERDPKIIAGAAAVGAALGADFVKVNAPSDKYGPPAETLKEAVEAVGKTRLIVSGGEQKDPETYIKEVDSYVKISGAAGAAVGRNLHQKSLTDAIELAQKLAKIIYG